MAGKLLMLRSVSGRASEIGIPWSKSLDATQCVAGEAGAGNHRTTEHCGVY